MWNIKADVGSASSLSPTSPALRLSLHTSDSKSQLREELCVLGDFFPGIQVFMTLACHKQPLNLPLIRQTNPDLQPVTPPLWLRNVPSRGWTQTFPHWSVSAHSQWLMFPSGINWHRHTHTCTYQQLSFQMLKEALSLLLGAKHNFSFNKKTKKMGNK